MQITTQTALKDMDITTLFPIHIIANKYALADYGYNFYCHALIINKIIQIHDLSKKKRKHHSLTNYVH